MYFYQEHMHWNNFLYLSSADTSREFLLSSYHKLGFTDAQAKSYENSYSLIYYLEQGKSFFEQSKKSPINIKPILLFYGMVFLIKASILTVDPNYPESSAVLAHGVSTRKRKKQNYQYMEDEVKLQKNGLFPHFSDKMFHMKHLEGTKIKIKSLLQEIPELSTFFFNWEKRKFAIPLRREEQEMYQIPEEVLDDFNMTGDRLIDFFNSKLNQPILSEKRGNKYLIKIPSSDIPVEQLPFRFHLVEDRYYWLKGSKELCFFPELIIHYLLLYHLSMIARYEIEWWVELIHHKPSIEYPLIMRYLDICIQKIPFLINQFIINDL